MPHRAIVVKARQPATKTVLKSSEGWEIPCQPCLNSSINFFIGVVTSRDQRIQNMAEHTEIRGFRGRRWQQGGQATGDHDGTSSLALSARGGNIGGTDCDRGTIWDGWTSTSGIGLHTAELFVAEGAKIVIAGRRAPEGE